MTPTAGSYAAAINSVFLVGDTQHLNIATVGAGSANLIQCNAPGVVGR